MFDIGAMELLLVAMVALIVIGPKDLPVAMRTAGRWMGQIRGMTKHFRVGLDAMIRDAEIEQQEKEWAERNAKIMAEHPEGASGEGEPAMKPLDEPVGDKATGPAGAAEAKAADAGAVAQDSTPRAMPPAPEEASTPTTDDAPASPPPSRPKDDGA